MHRVRIIPARAGFTAMRFLGEFWLRDHPRSRGVYWRCCSRRTRPRRIIPARAGFTSFMNGDVVMCRDHPRSRGVYARMDARARSASGSSPLARGLRAEDHERPGRGGIIPARAGFTGPADRGPGRRLDHPRSRGVYYWARIYISLSAGSSPLARGLHQMIRDRVTDGGIIPARAGFTLSVQ